MGGGGGGRSGDEGWVVGVGAGLVTRGRGWGDCERGKRCVGLLVQLL